MNSAFRLRSSCLCNQKMKHSAILRGIWNHSDKRHAMTQRATKPELRKAPFMIARAICLSAALMVPVSMVPDLQFAATADAKNGNGGGNGERRGQRKRRRQ